MFYKVLDHRGKVENKYNVTFLQHPQGRDVLLLDLLNLWTIQKVQSVCFRFFALFEDGNRLPLPSPLSMLPVEDQAVHLLLIPASSPPVCLPLQCGEWLDYSRWQLESGVQHEENESRTYPESEEVRKGDGTSSIPERERRAERSQVDDHSRHDVKKEKHSSNLFPASAVAPMDETVASLSHAANTASEITGQAARSIFNFAAKSIKSVAHNVASLTGHIQVGNHKVVVVREIAQGGFGIVFLVRDVHDGTMYAMKQMFCQSREQMDEAHLELRMLQKISGDPHIITLVDHASLPASKGQHRQVLLLFPFFSTGTAWDMIEAAVVAANDSTPNTSNWPFPERAALVTLLGTARALRSMHDEGAAHRDIKPHNILISDTFDPVIMDLGSVGPSRVEVRNRMDALRAEDDASCKCSAPYRAPEITQVTNECNIDEKVDIWSLGCTAFCLAFGSSPFESTKEGVLKLAILNAKYRIPDGNRNICGITYSTGYIELIQQMLQLDPSDRPDTDSVVQRCKTLLASMSS